MSAGGRHLVAFAVVLVALAGAAAAAGRLIDPKAPGGRGARAATSHAPAQERMAGMAGSEHGMGADPVRGLAVADHGLRLVVDDPDLRRGANEHVRFRVVGADGQAVRDFDVEHTKRMHLIVVRRDLTGFQHLHPRMRADGTWTTPVRLRAAGSYRLFADFAHDGEATTLAGDLRVDGPAELHPVPAPAPAATSEGGYEVRLAEPGVRAGEEADLRFTVTEHGRPVRTQPYLGAGGHLVALRDGDLAFLHVHPSEQARTGEIGFAATFPTPGRYRLFLQFQVAGRVQTVAFTQEVAR